MSGTNELRRPLGNDVPLPGGDTVDTPQQRMTLPGGTPGGGGNAPAAGPPPSGGIGDTPSPSGAMSFDGSRRTMMEEHLRNRAMVDQLDKSLKKLDAIRKSLTHLAGKQDIVTMEDIVGEAGKLVSHGIDPVSLAGILADAPQEGGGEALGAWVSSHAATATQAEQQMSQQYKGALHELGVSAIHLLMAHSNAQVMSGTIPPMGNMEQQQNPLMPGETDAPPSVGQGPGHLHQMQNQLGGGVA